MAVLALIGFYFLVQLMKIVDALYYKYQNSPNRKDPPVGREEYSNFEAHGRTWMIDYPCLVHEEIIRKSFDIKQADNWGNDPRVPCQKEWDLHVRNHTKPCKEVWDEYYTERLGPDYGKKLFWLKWPEEYDDWGIAKSANREADTAARKARQAYRYDHMTDIIRLNPKQK